MRDIGRTKIYRLKQAAPWQCCRQQADSCNFEFVSYCFASHLSCRQFIGVLPPTMSVERTDTFELKMLKRYLRFD